MYKYISLFISIILLSSLSFAAPKIHGHITPLQEEKLVKPIVLDCGLVIQEASGSSIDVKKLNNICSNTKYYARKFLESKNAKANSDEFQLHWNISFIPEGSCYRCLNDLEYRFDTRPVKGEVIGYTDKNSGYIFTINNFNDPEFVITFVHELFHAFSMYNGYWDGHPGSVENKTRMDELWANEFIVMIMETN